MIVDEGKYYLYRHIDLTTKIPFYIGVGTKVESFAHKNQYHRAYNKTQRNKDWKSFIDFNDYDVEILLESNSRDFIFDKEIEFIKLYGRVDLGTGILLNKTSGGEKVNNVVIDIEHLKRASKISAKSREKIIYQYNLNGNLINIFNSALEIKEKFGYSHKSVSKCCLGNLRSYKGYCWSYKQLDISYFNQNYYQNEVIIKNNNSYMKYDNNWDYIETMTAQDLKLKYPNQKMTALINTAISRNGMSGGYFWKQLKSK